MPSRPACVVILLIWVYAAGALFRRDVLPDLWTTPPPDLRTVAIAGEDALPTKWDLSVAEGSGMRSFRSVGSAATWSERTKDGGTELHGKVSFDSGGLLKGTILAPLLGDSKLGEHLEISNICEIDVSGNLRRFHAVVHSAGDFGDLLTIDGKVVDHSIVVKTQGSKALGLAGKLNWSQTFAYEPRGLIQNGIGPIDRLPGLQVGQRWDTKVVNPLTGWIETVRTEVTGKHTIQWDDNPVTTLEVVQKMSTISARTWVRRDGLVLRQEVPLPFVKLVLERLPDRGKGAPSGVKAP